MASIVGLCIRRSRTLMISQVKYNLNKFHIATISTSKKNTDSAVINDKHSSVLPLKDSTPLAERDEVI